MLTIIIGVVISLWSTWLVDHSNLNHLTETLAHIAITVALSILIITGVLRPIGGYEEPELVEEIEFVTLSNSTSSTDRGSRLYVCVSANNVYLYRYEVPNTSTVEGKMYKVATVSGNITESETDTDKPVLQIYEAKAKKSIWGPVIGEKKTSYVFVVPTGSISYSIEQ